MIQATELRIGNYLTYHTPDDTDIPCKIDAQDILNISTNHMHNAEIHSPIPLTEEILLKCGFEKDEVVKCLYHLKIGNIIISITIEGSDVLDVTFANTNITGVSIDTESCLYLHGLQNITHALTNTELNIKPSCL
jgi:hypothetical protein